MAQVARIRNPKILEVPEIVEFITRGVKGSLYERVPSTTLIAEFAKIIADPLYGVFFAVECGTFKGLLVVALPHDGLIQVPQVPIFYTEGPRGPKAPLIKAALEWGIDQGYTRFWTINTTGRVDKVWKRAFARAGTPRRIGSIMEFTVG